MIYTILLQIEESLPEESQVRDFLDQMLTFLYTLAHWFGAIIGEVISAVLNYEIPGDLIDPLGFLILITIFLAVAEVAKRLTWFVVVVGWILILLRIVLEIFNP
jgi:hypothetical protein